MFDDPCRQKETCVMLAYKCKIASIDGEIVEKFMQASSMTSLKKQVAKEGGTGCSKKNNYRLCFDFLLHPAKIKIQGGLFLIAGIKPQLLGF
jgi:hypothetical protein